MNTKAFFPCAGGSNLILVTDRQNQIFFPKTPATVNFLHQIMDFLKNHSFYKKKLKMYWKLIKNRSFQKKKVEQGW